MKEVLVFDCGTTILGVFSVTQNVYRAYRSRDERREGARRIVDCASVIVSFNGTGWDLPELCKLLNLPSPVHLDLKGEHHDMMPIISGIRWPPDPGSAPINGPNLADTYHHYFGDAYPTPPPWVTDPYEISNWLDCKMTADLWTLWQRGELRC